MSVDDFHDPSRPSSTSFFPMENHERAPHLAVVATLAGIAILTSILRTYTLGKRLRAFGVDDGMVFVATLLLIALLVMFIYCSQLHPSKLDGEGVQAWLLALKVLHVVGIGLVKISVLLFLVIMAVGKGFRCTLFVLIGSLAIMTLFWFFSTLFRCIPLGDWWNAEVEPLNGQCMSPTMYFGFAVANNTANVASEIGLVGLMLVLAGRLTCPRPSRAFLSIPLCFALLACAAAVVRTRIFFLYGATRSELPNHEQSTSLAAWSIIELSTALAAVNFLLLALSADALIPCLYKRRPISVGTIHRISIQPTDMPSHNSRYSSTTVIYRPDTAYYPRQSRFHDDISNLDFDIETPASRLSNPTILSQDAWHHTRNTSTWSRFSGFTYSASTIEPRDVPDRSLMEMGEIIQEMAMREDCPEIYDMRNEKATLGGHCANMDGAIEHEIVVRTHSTSLKGSDGTEGKESETTSLTSSNDDSESALSFIDIPRRRYSRVRFSSHLENSLSLRQN